MPRILRHPVDVWDKEGNKCGSLFCEKEKVWRTRATRPTVHEEMEILLETCWRSQQRSLYFVCVWTIIGPSVRATWHTMQTFWIMQSVSDVAERGSGPLWVSACCRVPDHEMSGRPQCSKQSICGSELLLGFKAEVLITEVRTSGHPICLGVQEDLHSQLWWAGSEAADPLLQFN